MLPPPQLHSMVSTQPDDDIPNTDPSEDKFSLHSDDPKNFLKLCSALRILVYRRLSNNGIEQADRLLHEYCSEIIPVSPISFCG